MSERRPNRSMQLKRNPALAAVMLLAASLVLFIGAFGAEQPIGSGGTKSFDPWSADRKFCGRLTIHLTGAGEITPYYMNGIKIETRNLFAEVAAANFRDFYGNGRNSMPSISF